MRFHTFHQQGRWAQDLAEEHLLQQGYKSIARNVRCRFGEIDLIMADGATVVFIEVKARTTLCRGSALQAVDGRKQYQLSKLALWYLKQQKIGDKRARFDVVAVDGSPESYAVKWIRNAFEFRCA